MRREVSSLQTRLENKGKRITRISLAECLEAALKAEATLEEWFDNERMFGAEKAIEDVHKLLADRVPLVDLVAKRMPSEPDPRKDIVFIVRTGALFPVYRTFSLLEQLKGRVVGLCQSNGRSSARGATRPPSSVIQAARARHSANVAERLCL